MPKMSKPAANAALDAVTALANVGGAGTLTVHTGAQPSEPASFKDRREALAAGLSLRLAHLLLLWVVLLLLARLPYTWRSE